jgi:hypothetical protein
MKNAVEGVQITVRDLLDIDESRLEKSRNLKVRLINSINTVEEVPI